MASGIAQWSCPGISKHVMLSHDIRRYSHVRIVATILMLHVQELVCLIKGVVSTISLGLWDIHYRDQYEACVHASFCKCTKMTLYKSSID